MNQESIHSEMQSGRAGSGPEERMILKYEGKKEYRRYFLVLLTIGALYLLYCVMFTTGH